MATYRVEALMKEFEVDAYYGELRLLHSGCDAPGNGTVMLTKLTDNLGTLWVMAQRHMEVKHGAEY